MRFPLFLSGVFLATFVTACKAETPNDPSESAGRKGARLPVVALETALELTRVSLCPRGAEERRRVGLFLGGGSFGWLDRFSAFTLDAVAPGQGSVDVGGNSPFRNAFALLPEGAMPGIPAEVLSRGLPGAFFYRGSAGEAGEAPLLAVSPSYALATDGDECAEDRESVEVANGHGQDLAVSPAGVWAMSHGRAVPGGVEMRLVHRDGADWRETYLETSPVDRQVAGTTIAFDRGYTEAAYALPVRRPDGMIAYALRYYHWDTLMDDLVPAFQVTGPGELGIPEKCWSVFQPSLAVTRLSDALNVEFVQYTCYKRTFGLPFPSDTSRNVAVIVFDRRTGAIQSREHYYLDPPCNLEAPGGVPGTICAAVEGGLKQDVEGIPSLPGHAAVSHVISGEPRLAVVGPGGIVFDLPLRRSDIGSLRGESRVAVAADGTVFAFHHTAGDAFISLVDPVKRSIREQGFLLDPNEPRTWAVHALGSASAADNPQGHSLWR